MRQIRLIGSVLAAVGPRPRLWPTLIRQGVRFVPNGWWRRPPFLPLPDKAMLAFRSTTQYGDPDHVIEPDDLVAWLDWCRQERARQR